MKEKEQKRNNANNSSINNSNYHNIGNSGYKCNIWK